MTYDELLSAEPSESESTSGAILAELLTHPTWRCYSERSYKDVGSLITRFMGNQARIKGLISDEVYAEVPAAVFHIDGEDGSLVRGALYLNGAVVATRSPDGTIIRTLFVDDDTANKWGYPDSYVYLPKLYKQE